MPENEKITINDKILQYAVLCDEKGYQLYLYPGMTVAELAFNVMVTIRLLELDGYIENKDEFVALIEKYYGDSQYAPLKGDVDDANSDG